MRNLTQSPSLAPGIQIGSRPATEGTLRLSANLAPECKRPLLLQEFFERLGVRYDAEPVDHDPVEIDLTIQALPGLQLMSGRMQGSRYRRTRVNSDPTDDVGLILNPKGAFLIGQRGQEIVLDDGEATLVSLTDSLETVHRPPGDLLVLRFPTRQLDYRLAGAQDAFLRRIPRSTPALRLLGNYFNWFRQEQTSANIDLQHSIVSHFYDLAAVAIGATRDAAETTCDRGLRAARLHAIKKDIAQNLDQPTLSLATLATRHSCTPRYIQRLFAAEGTSFSDYVLEHRLVLACRLLSDPTRRDEKISTVAYDAGFGDVSYFNRAFRQRYGETPSGIRVLAYAARH